MIETITGAKKIEDNENWRNIFDAHNDSVDAHDEIASDLAYIVHGNKCASAVAVGQYVLLMGSTISGLSDGAYKAAKAITANTAIDSTYLTAVSGGIANELNSKIKTQGNILRFQITNGSYAENDNAIITQTYPTSGTPDAYASNNKIKFRRAGNIEIFVHVIGQQDNTNQRLWFELIGANLAMQHISYGYYCAGDIATISQVDTSAELSIKFLEAFKVGQGGVGTSYIFVKYM